MKKKINILCIDIEGGKGGSSRSLFYALQAISKKKIFLNLNITVICRQDSWIKNQYEKIGIKCIIDKNIPRFTSLERPIRNIYQLIIFLLLIWPKSKYFRNNLKKMSHYDVLHFNHISLGILAFWCKLKKIGKKKIMHMRTMPHKNFFSKFLCKISAYSCKSFVYITENEKNHLHKLIGQPSLLEKIIYNPVEKNYFKSNKLLKNEKRLKIGILSSFSVERGIDRVIEIFESIPSHKKNSFVFIIAGNMRLEKNISGFKKEFLALSNNFADYVRLLGYEKNFIFLGM